MGKVDPNAPAIVRGIQTVGVGRQGSRPLDAELVEAILAQLRSGEVHPVSEGAFWGALIMKGVTDSERALAAALPAGALDAPPVLAAYLCADAPASVRDFCARLLGDETLSRNEAATLGRFLFSDAPGEKARGLVASILRVRYETDEEYEGLLAAMQETLAPPFREPMPAGPPVAQIAEPFDGVVRSYFITPVLADLLQARGYRAVQLLGRSSGPKFGMNALDLHRALGGVFAHANGDLAARPPAGGWAIDQAELSPALDRWVERRWNSRKRPFLATLEKFLNPCAAALLVSSAFHPPYTKKMTTAAERAGFPRILMMRRGVEGSLTPNVARPVEVMASVRRRDGGYVRQSWEWPPEELLGVEPLREENVERPQAEANAALVRAWQRTGSAGDTLFDRRIALFGALLDRVLAWMETAAAGAARSPDSVRQVIRVE